MRPTSILLTMILILIFFTMVNSQDRNIYMIRDNRMEGRKTIGVSAPDLELLSFTVYREKLETNSSVELKLKFYMWEQANLYITAKELIPKEFYFMNPLKIKWSRGWQEFSSWPTKAVLDPLAISIDKLGILGRMHNDRIGSGEIVPIIVYHSEPPKFINEYEIYFIASHDLRIVDCILYKIEKNKNIPIIHKQLKYIFAGIPFLITLNLSGQSQGYYQLLIDCDYKDRVGGPQRKYKFFHKPDAIY